MNQINYSKKYLAYRQQVIDEKNKKGRTMREKNIVMYVLVFMFILAIACSK